jgi:predicted metal-dependent phosphoesterase TrpH
MTPVEAVETLHRYGAPAVMAHPSFTKSADVVLPELVQHGLNAMEVYYKNYDAELVARLAAKAKELGILPLGGSDYHALNNPGEREPGDIPLPDRIAKDFLEKELPWVSTGALG